MFRTSCLVILCAASVGLCDPPSLTVPPEVKPSGQYVDFVPETDAVSVTYVGLSGVEPLPGRWLSDKRAFVFDTYGKPTGRYKFVAVAAGKTGEQARASFEVVIGGAAPTPTPTPTPVDPPPPGAEPPAAGGKLYFLIVRPDGPASPDFTKVMQLPAWKEIAAAGHQFKDKTVTEAAPWVALDPSTPLPAVVTFQISQDGKTSTLVRGSVPLPTTDAGIRDLPKGVTK